MSHVKKHIWQALCTLCHNIGSVSTGQDEDKPRARRMFRAQGWTLKHRDDGGNICPAHGEGQGAEQEKELSRK